MVLLSSCRSEISIARADLRIRANTKAQAWFRLAWLYDEEGNTRYELTEKDEPFKGTQVTREAVAQLVLEIIQSSGDRFAKRNLGASKPDMDWDKPSFY